MMSTEDKKRKKEINSTGSISEVEHSESPSQNEKTLKKQSARKAKMSKVADAKWKPDCNVSSEINDIKTQLKDINHKLANVASTVDRSIEEINTKIKQLLEKDDTRMRETMKDLLSGIKDEIVKAL
ncbi:hypothetical protein DPMN_181589 [Dreissena polymorpha]|uniref:Uncharacterized protein n=1 Tax=Dreissena polymorpha TaxID=45954 RepID=A0A9D4DDU3_DREPO|nr:hypothetical protein DPMN_181589 [Dreissena polymorpha]